jgi:excisionase family DNA binding protein
MGRQPNGNADDVLSTAQAAGLLGLSARQVREHAEAGRLRGTKLNPRTWVFRRADVAAFTPAPRGRPKKTRKKK